MQKEERRLRAKMLTGQKPVAIHPSLPSFALIKELIVLSQREEVFTQEILQQQLVCLYARRPSVLRMNGEDSGAFDGHLLMSII